MAQRMRRAQAGAGLTVRVTVSAVAFGHPQGSLPCSALVACTVQLPSCPALLHTFAFPSVLNTLFPLIYLAKSSSFFEDLRLQAYLPGDYLDFRVAPPYELQEDRKCVYPLYHVLYVTWHIVGSSK